MPSAPKPVPGRPAAAAPKRASSTARGYGQAHRRQRERLLARHPVCQVCRQRWATDLHHIDGDPFNRADSNALMVCETCHHGRIHGGGA